MAKLTCFLALLVVIVVCAEAIRIDPPRPSGRREISNLKINDPHCKEEKGMFVDTKDCTKYYKCLNGNGQHMKCPDGFKFDSVRRCILPHNNPDCGKPKEPKSAHPGVDVEKLKCPQSVGKFPVSDCHKYLQCVDGVGKVEKCPEQQFYSTVNYRCITSKKCPQPRSNSEAKMECKKEGDLKKNDKDCRKYFVCKNKEFIPKTCPPGKAFDTRKRECTVKKRRDCKKMNDIRHVEPDE